MFIYMRALKCHPAIEQSGQAKSMRRRVIQLWSQMVKGPWHTSYLSSFFTLTYFDGEGSLVDWAIGGPPGQTLNSVISLKWNRQKWCPVSQNPKHKFLPRQTQVLGVKTKTCVLMCFSLHISNQIPTRHVMWQAMMLACGGSWMRVRSAVDGRARSTQGSDHLM